MGEPGVCDRRLRCPIMVDPAPAAPRLQAAPLSAHHGRTQLHRALHPRRRSSCTHIEVERRRRALRGGHREPGLRGPEPRAPAPAGLRGPGRAHARGDPRAVDEDVHTRRVGARAESSRPARPAIQAHGETIHPRRRAALGRGAHLRRQERRAADPVRRAADRRAGARLATCRDLHDVRTMLTLLAAHGRGGARGEDARRRARRGPGRASRSRPTSW